jgi:CMP-2-keto-3-deoxyoctulosonic acid synthetase
LVSIQFINNINNYFNHISNGFLSAALLAQYGNIKKDIRYPIQRINQVRMLSNGENISVIPTEKKLQIIA